MNYNRPLILLSILILRFTQSFQPTSAVPHASQNSLSVGSSKPKNSLLTKLFTSSLATTRKMATRSPESETESECDEKSTVVFSSSLLKDNDDVEIDAKGTALIVLNYPIPNQSPLLDHLWKTSGTRIAADGGANRLYQYSKDLIPDRIRGDLDSLSPSVRSFYENQQVSVEQDFCQDTNDLDKALQVLVQEDDSTTVDRVIIYGAFGGRFDQEMASFAALYKWAKFFGGQLYLYSDETCAFLIPANTECEIRLPFYDDCHQSQPLGEGPTCGLIPLGCRCESIVTSGLKWDLDGSMPLEFGGLVSSSNRVMESSVKVVSSHPIVFTAELTTAKKS